VREAANGNFLSHCLPTHVRDKLIEHHFQRDAVQWVQWTPSSHVIDTEECVRGRRWLGEPCLIREVENGSFASWIVTRCVSEGSGTAALADALG